MAEIREWDQQPGEKTVWFERFEIYLKMGAKRSKIGAYNVTRKQSGMAPVRDLPPAWFKASVSWNWSDRAAAYDRDQAMQRREEWDKDKAQDRRDRINMLKAIRGKVYAALPQIDFTKASPNTVLYAMQIIITELRKEYESSEGEDLNKNAVPGALRIREVVVEHTATDDGDEEDDDNAANDQAAGTGNG